MEKVSNLHLHPDNSTGEAEGVVKEVESAGAVTMPSSQSNHSLNSGSGISKGISFGAIFRR